MSTPALDGLRVLAVEQYGAGPYGSLHLADLGADVIKIEQPDGGDVGRSVPPYAEQGDSLFFETFNRNKRSITLDLRTPAGRAVFEDLVHVSDAVYSNLRGDVVEQMRLRYQDLADLNPRIVCCSLSGFGTTGPRRHQPAFDYMLQGLSGWMSLTGEPDGPPAKSGLSLVDYSAGLAAAAALLAGVLAARRDGTGRDCDVSLFDTAYSMLSYVATWQLTRGHPTRRQARSAHPSITPFQAFPTADGWLVAGGSKEKFWVRMARAIGRQDLLEDERFTGFRSRLEHRDELVKILDSVFETRTTEEWVGVLADAGVPCAPVNDVRAALEDPQVAARDLMVETDHPRFGTVRSIASPVRAGPARGDHRRAPRQGEHNQQVLRDLLHYPPSRIAELASQEPSGRDHGPPTTSETGP
jgi:crotonobetainyl-CoA:carnitine CoA-transferase CaiB-like acyl-CoA transferase